jgi:hypothetical protein
MGEEDLEQMEGDVQDSLEDIQCDKVTHRDRWQLQDYGYCQCCGSVPLTNGSSYVSCYFRQ